MKSNFLFRALRTDTGDLIESHYIINDDDGEMFLKVNDIWIEVVPSSLQVHETNA